MSAISIVASLVLAADVGAEPAPAVRPPLEVVRVHLKDGRSFDGVLMTRAADGVSCRTSPCPLVVLCLPSGQRRHLGATVIERIDEVPELAPTAGSSTATPAEEPVDAAVALRRCTTVEQSAQGAERAEDEAREAEADGQRDGTAALEAELPVLLGAARRRAARVADVGLAGTEETRRRRAPLLDSSASVTATLGVVLGSVLLSPALLAVGAVLGPAVLAILAVPIALAWLIAPSTADYVNGNISYALVRSARRVGIPALAGAVGGGLIVAANVRFCAFAANCGGSGPSSAAMLIAGGALVLGAVVSFIVFTIIDIVDQRRSPDRYVERLNRE